MHQSKYRRAGIPTATASRRRSAGNTSR
jgi:hypothetical protein